jgi:hypothetical protein
MTHPGSSNFHLRGQLGREAILVSDWWLTEGGGTNASAGYNSQMQLNSTPHPVEAGDFFGESGAA